jgi:signal transduction histidine kinase
MTIRNRLALRFMLLASLILGVAFLVVYLLSVDYRAEEFTMRLKDRGTSIALVLKQLDDRSDPVKTVLERVPGQLYEEAVVVLDRQGNILFNTGTWMLAPIDKDLLARIVVQGEVDLDGTGGAIGFLVQERELDTIVLISGYDRFGWSKIANLRRVMVITYGIGMLITFLLGRFYARRALDPLRSLVDEVRLIHVGDLRQRVSSGNGRDEIAQLASSFNDMLERLEKNFRTQRTFIANASHELRTPLTMISGQLEVLLLMDRTGQEYRQAVSSVLEDMRSLNRLSNRLLLLAQTEDTTAQRALLPVRLDEVIWQVRSEYQRKHPDHRVDVVLAEVEEERYMEVMGNDDLLRSLVLNLVENGCKYSPDHAVEVGIYMDERRVSLSFSDRGIGIPEDERTQIFDAFYRGSNTTEVGGHGIGLSLVKRIVELHNASIRHLDRQGGGTVFTVMFDHL